VAGATVRTDTHVTLVRVGPYVHFSPLSALTPSFGYHFEGASSLIRHHLGLVELGRVVSAMETTVQSQPGS
jgi:hypothetical protein